MDLSTPVNPGNMELSAPEAAVDRRSKPDASAWAEAVDWAAADCGALRPSEWRMATAPDFD